MDRGLNTRSVLVSQHAEVVRPAALSDAAARRLSNQIARAIHGTFGARTGLQTIASMVAQQMLAAGSTPEAIARTFEECVVNHPARLDAENDSALTGGPQSRMLVQLMHDCIGPAVAQPTDP